MAGKKVKEIGGRIWKDIRDLKAAWIVLAVYFLAGRYVLHSLCPVAALTGFPCPGCGMTRAVSAILRGDFSAAWKLHPFSYPIVILSAAFAWKRYVCGDDGRKFLIPAVVVLALMIPFYAWRMLMYFPGEPPMSYYYGSLLGRLLSGILCFR